MDASGNKGVGAIAGDTSAQDSGAVYVYTRSGVTWTLQAYIKPSNTRANAAFGTSVALAGDTLVVGAPYESSGASGVAASQSDTSAPGAGAVYVFTRTAGVWAQTAYVKASNARSGSYFGTSIAIAGDAMVVGAEGESSGVIGDPNDTSAVAAGAAYVFRRSAGAWTQEAYLKASNARFGAGFGHAVGLSSDTVVVGAYFESSSTTGVDGDGTKTDASKAGAAYVFDRTASLWKQSAYLKASNARAGAQFGGSVAVAGDLVAVGSPIERGGGSGVEGSQTDTSAPEAGAVYVFHRGKSGAPWAQQAYVKALDPHHTTWFGVSLAIENGTVAIGAKYDGQVFLVQ